MRRIEIDLIGADRKATHCNQLLGLGKDLFGQLRARADADDMRVADRFIELFAIQRLHQARGARVARARDELNGTVINPLQEQNTDLVLGERKLRIMSLHGPRDPVEHVWNWACKPYFD